MSAQQIRWACSLLPWHLGAEPPSHRLLLSSCSKRVSPRAAKRALNFYISLTSWPSPWDAQFFCRNIVILAHQELPNFIVLITPSSYDLSNARETARTSVCFFHILAFSTAVEVVQIALPQRVRAILPHHHQRGGPPRELASEWGPPQSDSELASSDHSQNQLPSGPQGDRPWDRELQEGRSLGNVSGNFSVLEQREQD